MQREIKASLEQIEYFEKNCYWLVVDQSICVIISISIFFFFFNLLRCKRSNGKVSRKIKENFRTNST